MQFHFHTFFVDDIFVFCRGDIGIMHYLKSFLHGHDTFSGLWVSPAKSHFYTANVYVSVSFVRYFKRFLACNKKSLLFIYLGVPIFLGLLMCNYFGHWL